MNMERYLFECWWWFFLHLASFPAVRGGQNSNRWFCCLVGLKRWFLKWDPFWWSNCFTCWEVFYQSCCQRFFFIISERRQICSVLAWPAPLHSCLGRNPFSCKQLFPITNLPPWSWMWFWFFFSLSCPEGSITCKALELKSSYLQPFSMYGIIERS